jgi:hypothetical protein
MAPSSPKNLFGKMAAAVWTKARAMISHKETLRIKALNGRFRIISAAAGTNTNKEYTFLILL